MRSPSPSHFTHKAPGPRRSPAGPGRLSAAPHPRPCAPHPGPGAFRCQAGVDPFRPREAGVHGGGRGEGVQAAPRGQVSSSVSQHLSGVSGQKRQGACPGLSATGEFPLSPLTPAAELQSQGAWPLQNSVRLAAEMGVVCHTASLSEPSDPDPFPQLSTQPCPPEAQTWPRHLGTSPLPSHCPLGQLPLILFSAPGPPPPGRFPAPHWALCSHACRSTQELQGVLPGQGVPSR